MLIKSRHVEKEKGMATLEVVSLLIVFVVLISFGFGFFGVIHTGILNSISARQYAFETFRNRSNVRYHRNQNGYCAISSSCVSSYIRFGFRLHTITSRKTEGEIFVATTRKIAFLNSDNERVGSSGQHNQQASGALPERRERLAFNPVWIKTGYGICLNAQCGGQL